MPPSVYVTGASREYVFIPGAGGFVRVTQRLVTDGHVVGGGAASGSVVDFDIRQWVLQNIFINQRTPHSGLNGGPGRTRVGHDWNVACVLDFPSELQGGTQLAERFVESLLGSMRGVQVQLNVGDPAREVALGRNALNYRAQNAILGNVEIRNNAEGTEVVGINAILEGNSMLWAYRDGDSLYPMLWS